jgi:magnesium and cobalt transporter
MMLTLIRNLLRKLGFKSSKDTLRSRLVDAVYSSSADDFSLTDEEKQMIKNILHLNEVTVSDIMVPRADIVSVSRDITLDRLTEVIARHPFTRLVVYQKTLDDVKGFIHVKDIYSLMDAPNFSIKSIIRKPLLVVASMPIVHLLLLMRRTQIPIALVIDEYGGVDGLLTTWDILREVLGEVEESHEPELSSMLRQLPDGSYEADARLPIEEFSELFGVELSEDEKDDDIDTIGGLIVWLAGRVPDRCELIRHPAGVEFEILDANPRRVTKVKMRSVALEAEGKGSQPQ